MNVVQLSSTPAYPPDRGVKIRIHNLVAHAPDVDQITRFAEAPLSTGSETIEIRPGYVEHRMSGLVQSVLGVTAGWVGLPPGLWAGKSVAISVPDELRQSVREADVVIVERPWPLPYLETIDADAPVVYSSHNFEPDVYAGENPKGMSRLVAKRVLRAERRIASRADLTVVTSRRDLKQYKSAVGTECEYHIAPNAATVPDELPDSSPAQYGIREDAPLAVFVGSEYGPNIEAVEHLLDIAEDCPELSFAVAGTVCRNFDSTPQNVHLLGFVDDISELYAAGDIGLNPMVSGGGTNIKVLEYFAHDLFVVTTPFGARGLQIKDGVHCRIAEVGELPSVLTSLVESPLETYEMRAAARELVKNEYNWETVSWNLFSTIHETLIDQ